MSDAGMPAVDTPGPHGMSISQVAALAGVSARAVRHYHRVGALQEPARSRGGYRLYDLDDLERLLALRMLVAAGVPLRDIAHGPLPAVDLETTLDQLRAERDRLDERIERLRELVDTARSGGAEHASAVAALERAAVRCHLSAEVVAAERRALDLLRHTSDAGQVFAALTAAYDAQPGPFTLPESMPETLPEPLRRIVAMTPPSELDERWLEALVTDPELRARVRTLIGDARSVIPEDRHGDAR